VGDAAVEVRGLVKSYAGARAVDGLSLTVRRGEILALLGPNGAGKTTTVEICEGFRRADAGEVLVLGRDPHRDGGVLKPRVGVMLQGGVGGYTAARAGELLELFAGYAARPLDVPTLLDRVGLREVAAVQVRRLSGGQQQRLSLALALVGRPELVFLDEPTAGMDPQARHATWGLLRELRTAGVTVVLTTHFLDEAEQLADSVVVVDVGQVVAAGTPAQLARHGAEGQIRLRVSVGLRVAELRDTLPPGTRVIEEGPGRYLVTGEVTPQLLATLTAWCASQDVLVEQLSVERRSLEDVFLDLTGHAVRA
jgi:ABC-2 type transport system ATP-binding protein